MIELPRRSVTRFFIPLIDVLTLLFCIFLLMPLVQATGDDAESAAGPRGESASLRTGDPVQQEQQRLEQLKKALDEESRKLDDLRKESMRALQQRLAIRVLEISAANGKLYYYDPDPVEIAGEADARKLINRHRKEAGKQELYYLFLFPRKLTGYPEEKQVRDYERWFKDVAHGIDNPRVSGR